jgi:crotonobetainyl-CoA:carnitine CoA-transferase CaiB-like acyl-CoA transferase
MIGAWTGPQTERFWHVLGFPDRAEQARDQPITALESASLSVIAEVQQIIRTKSGDEWEETFAAAQVPAARVRTLDEAIADPQTRHRETISASPDGTMHTVGAFCANVDGPSLRSSPPHQGAHTDEVLREVGLTEAEGTDLAKRGVIGGPYHGMT